MVNFLYDGWEPIARIVVVGTLGYVALVLLLRASGKRTLTQMSSFDFVITVAIGASFGRVLTARPIPLAEAVTAFALLIGLQLLVSTAHVRSSRFAALLRAEPALIAYRGELRTSSMRRHGLTEDEVLTAVRRNGHASVRQVGAVVLEPDGTLSVIEDLGGDGLPGVVE